MSEQILYVGVHYSRHVLHSTKTISKFHSVLLYDLPYSTYNLVENQKYTQWP